MQPSYLPKSSNSRERGSRSAEGGLGSLAVLTGVEGFRGDNPGPKEGGLSFFCESP